MLPSNVPAPSIHQFRPFMAENVATYLAASLCPQEDGRVLIGEGPQVAAFENELTAYCGHPLLATSSGTAALWLAYRLANIRPRDVVITSPLSCLASTQSLLHFGAHIRWADVDPMTGMIDPEEVRRNTFGASAVVVVDWGGARAEIRTIREICDEKGMVLIEDAAHSFGVFRTPAMLRAHFIAYSFQAIKALTTGDGGALYCEQPMQRDRARRLRWFGLDRTLGASMRCTQDVGEPGYKFQMNDIAASIGRANLVDLEARIERAREIARTYDRHFMPERQGILPFRRQDADTAWLYSVRVHSAQRFIAAMATEGIETSQVHARNDVQSMFASSRRTLLGMDTLEREMVCLPCGWWMSDDDVQRVIRSARKWARA